MKKLKTFLLILLCALFVGALAACGGGKKYTVTFETYGGTQIEAYELKKGAEIQPPADPEKALFTFAGWYADDEFTQEFDFTQKMPENDVTVYARWTSETSSRVSYNSMGGSAVEPSVGIVGNPITAPADPTYEGYKFGGWYVDAEYSKLFVFTTFPAESTTVYARWVNDPNYAYIDYVGNGSRLACPCGKGRPIPRPISSDTEKTGSPHSKGNPSSSPIGTRMKTSPKSTPSPRRQAGTSRCMRVTTRRVSKLRTAQSCVTAVPIPRYSFRAASRAMRRPSRQ